ncbi:hypothetical protein NDU88_003350 [Pleurodeles waltl]|uniref:Uncharacterized protein n=1 Tax=Pleurodeles waltl TaxID=8319 RepID=A0AAV7T5Y0_PLEWA|nr:hypothetical protein NDU88_003350 [Pleurodeles waltl]
MGYGNRTRSRGPVHTGLRRISGAVCSDCRYRCRYNNVGLTNRVVLPGRWMQRGRTIKVDGLPIPFQHL